MRGFGHHQDDPDSFVAVLSDGLGSGVKANIMSTLTAEIAVPDVRIGRAVEDVMETLVETLPECRCASLPTQPSPC